MGRAARTGAGVAAVVVALAGCGSAETPPDSPRPPNLVPPTSSTTFVPVAPIEVGRSGLEVSSPLVLAGGEVALDQLRDPPRLHLASIPEGTATIAVRVFDLDLDRTHWLVADLPPTGTIDPSALPAEAVVYQNDAGEQDWLPVFDPPRRLRVEVWALPRPVDVPADRAGEALGALDQAASDRAAFTFTVTEA